MPGQGWTAIYMLAFGAVVTLAAMTVPALRKGRLRGVLLALMVVMAVLGIGNYFRWGAKHKYPEPHLYHFHDIFHYEIGAKYFPELGYYHMYDCVHVARIESREERGIRRHPANHIRNLRHPLLSTPGPEVFASQQGVCHDQFSPERWAEFRADIDEYSRIGDRFFRVIFFDLGFNPPPTWSVIGHTVANAVPVSQANMDLLPYLDIILLYGVATVAIGWAFGPEALALYFLIMGTNFLSHFGWTGGSYFRMMWLAALVVGLSLLKKERHWQAGILLGLATVFRIFPAVFAIGAVWAVAWQAYHKPERRKALAQLVAAGLGTGLVMLSVSLMMFGTDPWRDFFVKIFEHGDTYYVNHIGFKKAAVYKLGIAGQNFHGPDGLVRFGDWQLRLQRIYERHAEIYTVIRLGLVAAAFYFGRRLPSWEAAVTIGGTLLFVGSIPANYYYSYLALFSVVWYVQKGGVWPVLRMVLFLALMITIQVLPLMYRDDLVYNGHHNQFIFLFFWLMWVTYAVQEWSERPKTTAPEGATA